MSAKRGSSSEFSRPSSSDIGPVILSSSAKKPVNQNSNQMDLLQREADYKRLNEELEAKTTSLFQETESMLRQQEEYLAAAAELETQGPDYYVDPRIEGDEDDEERDYGFSQALGSLSLMDDESGDVFQPSAVSLVRQTSHSTAPPVSMPPSIVSKTAAARPVSASGIAATKQLPKQARSITAPGKVRNRSGLPGSSRSSARPADDVALVDDPAMMRDINLEEAFERIAHEVDNVDAENQDDEILPPPAQEMGHEAKVRFLKAKVRVLQEELEKLSAEKTNIVNESEKRAAKMKSIEEDRNRLQKSASTQQSAFLKQKQVVDDLKSKLTAAETQASTLKRQNDQLQRDAKAQQSNVGATEVRLNRALEEIEKLKSDVTKAKSSSKENQQDEKKRLDSLMAENRKLEKQKSDLIQGFRKQARLIDVLKRQKMHLEAAKMLQFTEEEFVKALEWGSG